MNATQMNKERFWEIIDDARQATVSWKSMFEPLMDRLSALGEQDIARWGHIFNEYFALSYKEKLWAAAYIILDGCSDGSFDYFRGWLIAQGKEVFMNALANPESLADVQSVKTFARERNASEYTSLRGYVFSPRFEDILSAAPEAYDRKPFKKSDEKYGDISPKLQLSKEEKMDISNDITYADDIDIQWVGERSFIENEKDKGKILAKELLPKLQKVFDGDDSIN